MCVGVLPACSLCTACILGTQGGNQKMVSGHLELEIQMVVSHHMGVESGTQILRKMLLTAASSPQPPALHFLSLAI